MVSPGTGCNAARKSSVQDWAAAASRDSMSATSYAGTVSGGAGLIAALQPLCGRLASPPCGCAAGRSTRSPWVGRPGRRTARHRVLDRPGTRIGRIRRSGTPGGTEHPVVASPGMVSTEHPGTVTCPGHRPAAAPAGRSRWRVNVGDLRSCPPAAGSVKGHVDLPAGGHETCPVAATRSAHRQPPELRQFVCAHLLNRRRHGGGAGCARSVRATSSSQLGQAPPMSTRRQNKLQSGQRRWPR